jgi:transcriptional regulator with XRE-family HTH domain
MAFKDLLKYLLDKAIENGEVRTQDEFGKRIDKDRATINQWLGGKLKPPNSTILAILAIEHCDLAEVVDAPEIQKKRGDLLVKADRLLRRGDRFSDYMREHIEMYHQQSTKQPKESAKTEGQDGRRKNPRKFAGRRR